MQNRARLVVIEESIFTNLQWLIQIKNRKVTSTVTLSLYLNLKPYRMPYFVQNTPFVVPTTDGKLIEEHTGLASTGNGQLSIARMVAPPGWSEPFQTPDFDEYTLVSSGRKQVEADGVTIVLEEGQSILVQKGTRVRYSNPLPLRLWAPLNPASIPCLCWALAMKLTDRRTIYFLLLVLITVGN